MVFGRCRLCRRERDLCQSHVIPAFVGRWLVSTSLTGRIRFTDQPNKPVQGLWKRPWFCEECECRLQQHEDPVNDRLFGPLHDGGQDRFRYGPALLPFAASLSWRVLMLLKDDGNLGALAAVPAEVDEAMETWRRVVLGENRSVGQYEQHIILLDSVVGTTNVDNVPTMLNRFIHRSIAFKPYYHRHAGYVITKLCRMLVVGAVVNTERGEWKGTKVHSDSGALGDSKYHVPDWVFRYLTVGAEKMAKTSISSRQRERISRLTNRVIAQDVERAADSGTVRAFDDDLRFHGPGIFAQDDDGEEDGTEP